jgi:hypothetical protein
MSSMTAPLYLSNSCAAVPGYGAASDGKKCICKYCKKKIINLQRSPISLRVDQQTDFGSYQCELCQ